MVFSVVLFSTVLINHQKRFSIFLLCSFSAGRHWVTSTTIVSTNQKPISICFIRHLKSPVLSVKFVVFKVLQINSQLHIISGCQTVQVVISKPELPIQVSKSVFVLFPDQKKIDRTVKASLKNRPSSASCGHITQHLNWLAAIWIDGVQSIRIKTILQKMNTALWFYWNKIQNLYPQPRLHAGRLTLCSKILSKKASMQVAKVTNSFFLFF